MAAATKSRKKQIIPEMLPRMEMLEESLVPAFLNISYDHFIRNVRKEGLKVFSKFGKKYYSVKQINELIEDSIIYNPPL